MEHNQSNSRSSVSVMSGLTYVQHLPTPFIVIFMLIHLTAPALATVGGTEAASQVMLLGREYYHGVPQEALLVYTPITIHVAASLAKRAVKFVRWAKKIKIISLKERNTNNARIISSDNTLQWTGYPLLLLLLPHVSTHRLFPSAPSPPISSISPSELDFSFVNFGLKNWPIRSWIMYSVLVGAGIMHVAYGMPLVWQQTASKLLKKAGVVRSDSKLGIPLRSISRIGLAGVGVVLLGLFRISQEDVFLTRLASLRIMASYRMSALYR